MEREELFIKLPIEEDQYLLQEYGRVVIIINNIEFFLTEKIKQKGGKITKLRPCLGDLIKEARETSISSILISQLEELNEKRIKLIHGVTMTTIIRGKDIHFIQKDFLDIEINAIFFEELVKFSRDTFKKIIMI